MIDTNALENFIDEHLQRIDTVEVEIPHSLLNIFEELQKEIRGNDSYDDAIKKHQAVVLTINKSFEKVSDPLQPDFSLFILRDVWLDRWIQLFINQIK